jgi:TatD DNase family protein
MHETCSLVDTHAHIEGKEFHGDFAAMLDRAATAGVSRIITIGADIESSRQACELANSHESIYCAVGIHPHDAARVTEKCYDNIRTLAGDNRKVVAIGEIGLDFYRDRSPRDIQETVFRRFLIMAAELSLPVVIHDRDAHEPILRILREEKKRGLRGVLHCFSGDLAMARQCVELGFYLSVTGTVTFPSNEQLRQVVRGISVDHLLLETDCPYLAPVPFRGKRNEPSYLRIVAEKVAELKGLSLADVARTTSHNADTLFGIGHTDQRAAIAYTIRKSRYLNITNRCSNHCSFCAKFSDFYVKGHFLHLEREPTAGEVLAAIGNPDSYDEIVFCGYGEPLLRLDLVREVATALKQRGCKIRINTDGQANLVYGRNILPELAGLIDTISVSLNAADAETYQNLCASPFGEAGFAGVCAFLAAAKEYIPLVIASAVTVPGLDIDAVRRVAESLGVQFREREYADVG